MSDNVTLNEIVDMLEDCGINIIHTFDESYSNDNSLDIDLFLILNGINDGFDFDESFENTYINSKLSKKDLFNMACEKNYMDGDGKILDDGYEFIIDNEWMYFYEAYLSSFNFDDFNHFYKNSDLSLEESGIEFLNKFIKLADEHKDFDLFIDCLKAKSHIYDHIRKFSKSLRYELKVFIYNLNPKYFDDEMLKNHFPLDEYNIDVLCNFKRAYSTAQIEKYFNKEWKICEFQKTFISKKQAWKILLNLLKNNNLDEYLEKLEEKYVIS